MGNKTSQSQSTSDGSDHLDGDHTDPHLHGLYEELAEKSRENDNNVKDGVVSRFVFESAFNGPLQMMGSMLYTHIQVYNALHHKKMDELISEKQFNRVCKEILALYSESQQQQYYFHLFSKGQDTLTKAGAKKMVELCYTLSIAAANTPYPENHAADVLLEYVATNMFGIEEILTSEHFLAWCNRHCPHMFSGVHSWLMGILTKETTPTATRKTPTLFLETLAEQDNLVLNLPMLWVLSSVLPNCYLGNGNITDHSMTMSPITMMNKLVHVSQGQPWSLLYHSSEHGLSMNRFQHHVFSYRGPTITLLTFGGKNVYCIASDTEWREETEKWGGQDCMVIQLAPYFRKVQEGEKMMFLNHSKRTVPKGIQIGKDSRNLVLDITSDMSEVRNYSVSLALHKIEVWGCAGSEIAESQTRQKRWENKDSERVANKKLHMENWNDCPDRQILEMAGIRTTRSQPYIQDVSMDD